MNERRGEKDPQEMSEEAMGILKLFQEAKTTGSNEEKQNELLRAFYNGLMRIVLPEGEKSDTELKEILLGKGKKYFYQDYFIVGGGSSGQRIYFKEYNNSSHNIESNDKKPRWMWYPKPSGRSWTFGEQYWERFNRNFGGEIVDLLQNIEAK